MKSAIVTVVLAFLFLAGCKSSEESIFYWGDYSETLYDLKHEPNDSTLATHQSQLFLIISTAPEEGKKIPPGVCAEYGYLLLKNGSKEEGVKYLDQEVSLYPESETFIKRLKHEYSRNDQ